MRLVTLTTLATLALAACTPAAPPAGDTATATTPEPVAPAAPVAAPATPAAPQDPAIAAVHASLQGKLWRLVDARDSQNRRISLLLQRRPIPFSLVFKPHWLEVRNSCNHLGGQYQLLAANALHLDNVQVTTRECPDAKLMEAEALWRTLLGQTLEIRWLNQNRRLQLTSLDGQRLTFDAVAFPKR